MLAKIACYEDATTSSITTLNIVTNKFSTTTHIIKNATLGITHVHSVTLSVTMSSGVMPNVVDAIVAIKPIMSSAIKMSFVMLSIIMLSVIYAGCRHFIVMVTLES
jgi:hypothetical protein